MEDLNYFILQGKVSNAVNIQNLKKYNNSDSEDKTVDGKVEIDKLVENTGKDKKGIDISLYTYLPIPIRRTDEYTTFDGATRVSYNMSGIDPQYYKDPYVIYHYTDKKTSSVENINWMMSFGKDTRSSATGATNLKYYPWLNQNNCLNHNQFDLASLHMIHLHIHIAYFCYQLYMKNPAGKKLLLD